VDETVSGAVSMTILVCEWPPYERRKQCRGWMVGKVIGDLPRWALVTVGVQHAVHAFAALSARSPRCPRGAASITRMPHFGVFGDSDPRAIRAASKADLANARPAPHDRSFGPSSALSPARGVDEPFVHSAV